jgi:hypothetical protein
MKVAIVEVLDRDGHARLIVPVSAWPITIGRAIECDVVLDDAHAAARHATLTGAASVVGAADTAGAEDALTLTAGETVNGVGIGKKRIAAGQSITLAAGDIFQIGNTRLRVRRATDALAAERRLLPEPRGHLIPVLGMSAALMLWTAGHQWLASDPGARYIDYLPMLLGVPIVLLLWAGFWSVGSKLVQHGFAYWSHVRVVLSYSLIMSVVGMALPLVAFMSGWTFFSRVEGLVGGALACAMIVAHLTLILPSSRRGLTLTFAALFVAGTSLYLLYNHQKQDRLFSELYVTTLAPPGLRLAPAIETSRFLDEARSLKSVLDTHAKDDDDQSEDYYGYD